MSDERTDGKVEGEGWLDRLLHKLSLRSRESIREDLQDVLSEAAETADFSPYERAMLQNVLGLHRIRVSDVMVPRADVVAVAADTTLGEVLALFRTVGHSRLPAYGETLDEPLGMVHIRDFLDHLASAGERSGEGGEVDGPATTLRDVDLGQTLAGADILRPVLFVPRSMPAVDLLVRMQASRTHMALVIDEYGGTDGLVSIEDLVEVVVGDIEDEHDETAPTLLRDEAGGLVADARASLEEVAEALGRDPAAGIDAEDIDTLGGLVVTIAGRVPSRGELIAGPEGLEFEVLDADPRRLKRVRVHAPPTDAAVLAPQSTVSSASSAVP